MKNVVARQHNGSVTHGSVPLGPMYDVHTGELIRDFPSNLNELDRLEGEFGMNPKIVSSIETDIGKPLVVFCNSRPSRFTITTFR